jgi:RNA polymerase sigma-70 factor (ECF subfamily)
MNIKTTITNVFSNNYVPYSFDLIFKKYYPRLCHFAFQILKNKASAEDIVQEAYVKYWEQKDTVSAQETSVKSFLYNTVKHACFNMIRHEKVVEVYLNRQDSSPVDDVQVINLMIRSEVLGEIYRALSTLPPQCQRISKMSFLDGMKNLEIAQELNISVNTVKTQKQRALQLLRLKINPELFLLLFLQQIR